MKYPPSVVSLTLGTANAGVNIAENKAFFDEYKLVVSVFDNDCRLESEKKGIKRGLEATQDVAAIIRDLNVLEIPAEYNDPNGYLVDYCGVSAATYDKSKHDEFHKLLTWGMNPYKPMDIVTGSVGLDTLLEPLSQGAMLECMPKLAQKMGGIRAGEFTLLLSPSGVGKTTLIKEIGLELAQDDSTFIDWVMVEEDAKKTQQSLIAMDNNVKLSEFRKNPRIVPMEEIEGSVNRLINNDRSFFVDAKASFGYIDAKRLLERMNWAAAKGATHILVDHFTMVLYGDSKVSDIDSLLKDIAAFCNSTGVAVIGVAHITRKERPIPKGMGGDPIYPHWIEVRKEDARGSGSFEQVAWNIITVEPQVLEGGERGRIRLRLDKNREHGTIGLCDVLTMDDNTGRLINANALAKATQDDPPWSE